MTKEEFINLAVSTGYSNKITATEYVEGKDKLTDKDFIEVYRTYEIKKRLEFKIDDDKILRGRVLWNIK